MAGSGAHSIAIDECMALGYVGEIAQEYHIGFLGNFHVTAALFEETEEATAEVQRCIHEGARFPGYAFGLGGPLIQHINPSRLDAAVTTLFHLTRSTQSTNSLTEDQHSNEVIVQRQDER
jgi:uroporphyrinogen-III decarboxylase